MDRLASALERDADEHAIARGLDPIALASAICKCSPSAAGTLPGVAFARLVSADTAGRVRMLAAGGSPSVGVAGHRVAATCCLIVACAELALLIQVPGEAAAAAGALEGLHSGHPDACPH